MFNQQEVQILIGGVNSPIDLDDLRKHTNYGGLYDDQHPVIVAFWKVCGLCSQWFILPLRSHDCIERLAVPILLDILPSILLLVQSWGGSYYDALPSELRTIQSRGSSFSQEMFIILRHLILGSLPVKLTIVVGSGHRCRRSRSFLKNFASVP
jgi:HECT-domain (ubiquitin-transferase)